MKSRNSRARLSRLLAPLCVGASLVALTVAACSVPEFEFPPPTVQGNAGDGSVVPEPTDPCQNKQIDADTGETDFDCGGACGPCGAGKHCVESIDCETDLLCHDGTCVGLGCMNDAQDGTETDTDCGGDDCKPCITGQSCGADKDCESGVCGDAKCLAPACDDQVLNGKETGLDCGGDCSPCPADQPCVLAKDCISGECNDQVCGSECPDGFANCDKQNDNACEVNTRTDLENCGFCDNACDLPHATAECSAGECRIATDGCAPGYQDCNGDPADGCEVDLKTNKLNCGACNKVCPDLNGDPSCVAGACQITCNDGFQDCDDNRDNGCEINTKTSSKNCAECGKACPAAAGYSAYCKDSACGQTLCAAGKGDCNGDPVDGCETTTTNDVDNCGGCGIKCQAVNANVACVNSQCVITTCQGTYADCNKGTANGFKDGCEADTSVDTGNCGGCGKACNIANGSAKCSSGSCEVNSCSGTFRDCDGDPKTGCEINIATNTKNCGGCGAAGSDCSTKYANASSSCASSACTSPVCSAGYGDCSGGIADGCETNTSNDGANCGGCGMACSTVGAHVTSNNCVNSQCDPKCSGSYLSCDGIKANGCEADSTTDEANCGACGTSCSSGASAHVTSNDCLSSSCSPVCSGTYGDCDASRTNGCEVDTATSASNCGGCGKVCSTAAGAHVTSNACSGSSCQPVCNGLYGDCDNNHLNGCEKDVSADINNCGGCGLQCKTLHATSGTSCGGGACNPSCDAGWAKCTTPEQGCVTPLGTTSNCTKCGEVCSSPTKFCDPAGCVDHRNIAVVKSVGWTAGWDGSSGVVAEIKQPHTLVNPYSNGDFNRLLIAAVATTDNYTAMENVSVKYAGVAMNLALEQMDSNSHSYAGIYYLLDAQLPDTGGTVLASFGPGNTWGHGGLNVVELKNAMQTAPIATAGAKGDLGCGTTSTRSASVTFNQTGSLVFGLMAARGATGISFDTSPTPTPTVAYSAVQATPDHLGMLSAYAVANSTYSMSWTLLNCYNSAATMVVFKRLNWN